jgi:ABC-type uncharacterized transport system permease subunit
MFSNSKSSSFNANASDGGFLTMGGAIAPVNIMKGISPTTLLLIAAGAVVLIVGAVLFLRK